MFTCVKCGTDWCQQPPVPSKLLGGFKCPWCGYVNENEVFEEILIGSVVEIRGGIDNEMS